MTIDIIETAREAGFVLEGDLSGAGRLPMLLERFAALVLEEARVWCGCGDAIMPDSGAQCGTCAYVASLPVQGHPAAADAGASTAPLPVWQPIETAPKDGTSVLAYGEAAGEIHGPSGVMQIEVACYQPGGDYRGFDWAIAGDAYGNWFKPSHWMPLPDAPHRRSVAGDQKPNEQDKSASPSVLLIRGEK